MKTPEGGAVPTDAAAFSAGFSTRFCAPRELLQRELTTARFPCISVLRRIGNRRRLRTCARSSAANVGADKGSDKRQRDAIAVYAKHAGFAVVDTYYDAAVSGADPIETRPGFLTLLDRIEGDGVRTVLIEDASRFARELITHRLPQRTWPAVQSQQHQVDA